jgi:acyl carrier protein
MYTNFFESNTLDSLNFAELIAAIEQEFLIEINFEDLVEWNSVNSPKGLANFIGNLNE